MDQGLFAKYLRKIESHTKNKEELISFLTEETGIEVEDRELSLEGKKIHLAISSVKKASLLKKGIRSLLEQKGYTLEG